MRMKQNSRNIKSDTKDMTQFLRVIFLTPVHYQSQIWIYTVSLKLLPFIKPPLGTEQNLKVWIFLTWKPHWTRNSAISIRFMCILKWYILMLLILKPVEIQQWIISHFHSSPHSFPSSTSSTPLSSSFLSPLKQWNKLLHYPSDDNSFDIQLSLCKHMKTTTTWE
jgi:hypothetical protein